MQKPLLNQEEGRLPIIRSLDGNSSVGMELDSDWHLRSLFASDPRQGCELLFRKYYKALCNHASRFVYNQEVAEDIVSEIFYNLWREEAYLTIKISYQTYLFQAVRYRAYNHLRWEMTKAKRSTDYESESNSLTDYEPGPSEIIQYDELHRRIEQAIEQLPPQCKRVFLLSRFEGKKYQEIADELNIGIKTVETHVSKALNLLRVALKDEWTLVVLYFLVNGLAPY